MWAVYSAVPPPSLMVIFNLKTFGQKFSATGTRVSWPAEEVWKQGSSPESIIVIERTYQLSREYVREVSKKLVYGVERAIKLRNKVINEKKSLVKLKKILLNARGWKLSFTSLNSSLLFSSSLLQRRNLKTKRRPENHRLQSWAKKTFGQLSVTYYKETPQSPKQGIPELPDQKRCVEVKAVSSDLIVNWKKPCRIFYPL